MNPTSNLSLKQQTNSDFDVYVAKIDYSRTIGPWKLETGAKVSETRNNSNQVFLKAISGGFVNDATRTNDFSYNEDINALYVDMSRKIELFVKQEKKLNANVDFYSASTYTTLGIDIDLFTPIFAVSRIAGWAAHVIEQHDDNRLIRPRADYTGPTYPAPYVTIGDS